jgi:glycine/D-amino acid oxidase-like deaminating enzyme
MKSNCRSAFFAGVVGLSTAVKIQERGGYRVTIVTETNPGDPKTIRYTSHWAVSQPSSPWPNARICIPGFAS